MVVSISLLIATAALAVALPSDINPFCSSISIPVTTSADNLLYANPPDPNNATDIKNFLFASLPGLNDTRSQHIDATFTIDATYCEPPKSVKSRDTLQFLVHGLAYDKTYWSAHGNAQTYDYARFATSQGYHTLAITRLGHGSSRGLPHPDPINIVQSGVHIDIVHRLIQSAKSGQLAGLPKKFKKTVYVGHSYGSTLATNHAAVYPRDVDAYVLTGFSSNVNVMTDFIPDLKSAATVSPRFANLPLGYLASETEAVATSVFYGGRFDPAVARREFEARDTSAVGEFLSPGIGPANSTYSGKILVVTGDLDAFFCAGGPDVCKETLNVTATLFPKASYEYVMVPESGHALNFHKSAPYTFQKVHTWLANCF